MTVREMRKMRMERGCREGGDEVRGRVAMVRKRGEWRQAEGEKESHLRFLALEYFRESNWRTVHQRESRRRDMTYKSGRVRLWVCRRLRVFEHFKVVIRKISDTF